MPLEILVSSRGSKRSCCAFGNVFSVLEREEVLDQTGYSGTSTGGSGCAAGPRMTAPSELKREPWQGHHRSEFSHERARPHHKAVDLLDLINAGLLQPGMPLSPRLRKFGDRVATLLAGGRVEVDGTLFARPFGAAVSITSRPTNGWRFFLVDQASRPLAQKRPARLRQCFG